MESFNTCRICQYTGKMLHYNIKERQINKGDVFKYCLCPRCGCLYLDDIIFDMSVYYSDDYYSFIVDNKENRLSILQKVSSFVLPKVRHLPVIVRMMFRRTGLIILQSTGVKKDDAIIDVGGGAGQFAHLLRRLGYINVSSIDLFCETSPYSDIHFKQCSLLELEMGKKYNLITFQDSFEHMDNPRDILKKACQLIKDGGVIAVMIPIIGVAWEMFKEDDYLIDAPRHYFIHTVQSISMLCKEVGLYIDLIEYDSSWGVFSKSYEYRNTKKSLMEIKNNQKKLSKRQKYKFRKMAIMSDIKHNSDRAVFYLRKAVVE